MFFFFLIRTGIAFISVCFFDWNCAVVSMISVGFKYVQFCKQFCLQNCLQNLFNNHPCAFAFVERVVSIKFQQRFV